MEEYRSTLQMFIEAGYEFLRLDEFPALSSASDRKLVMIRHDIDSDVAIAKQMWKIERELDVVSSWYFRRTTFDWSFMRDILKSGAEVSYHFEEIADYCKRQRTANAGFVRGNLEVIRDLLVANIKKIEEQLGSRLSTVAAHGDFMNRKIGIPNQVLVDQRVRDQTGLTAEAYDSTIEGNLDCRISDKCYPTLWTRAPAQAISEGSRRVLILVHTRWWGRAPVTRTLDWALRVAEEAYSWTFSTKGSLGTSTCSSPLVQRGHVRMNCSARLQEPTHSA